MDADDLLDWYARWMGARLSLMSTIVEVRRLGYWSYALKRKAIEEKENLQAIEKEMVQLGLLKERHGGATVDSGRTVRDDRFGR